MRNKIIAMLKQLFTTHRDLEDAATGAQKVAAAEKEVRETLERLRKEDARARVARVTDRYAWKREGG